MGSTRQDILNDKMIGGLDLTSPPHLIPPTKWRDALNFRVHEGQMQLVPWLKTMGGTYDPTDNCHHLISLSSGRTTFPPASSGKFEGTVNFVGLGTKVYQVRMDQASPLVTLNDADGVAFSKTGSWTYPIFIPWGWTIYANQVWFTQPGLPIHYTDGSRWGTYDTELPSSHLLENFFDHLVTANASWKGANEPYTVRWSDLYDPSQWNPTAENEADSYDINEWVAHDDSSVGVTALKKLNDLLVVYTQSSMVGCRYVGLPKVMQFFPIQQGLGVSGHRSLASIGSDHFFFDEKQFNFFHFDGQKVRPIGSEMVGFMESRYDASIHRTLLVSFIVAERREVWWSFFADGVTYYLVYNWKSNAWSKFNLGHVLVAAGGGGVRAVSADELAGTADGLGSGTVELLGDPTQGVPRVYLTIPAGGPDVFFRDAVSGDSLTSAIIGDQAYLETGDRYFGSLNQVKEMDGITIDASYPSGFCTGIRVDLATRERLGDTVTYQKVGVWHPGLKDNFLSFPKRVAGKIFRWRFVPEGNPPREVEWNAFTEHVYGAQAER